VVIDGSSLSCATGTGAANASDCDDSSATIHPGATEVVGDGIDQTCDGAESCYVDADGDGARTLYTVASPDASCTGSGEALGTADLDCDDGDADAYPGATEIVGDGVDEDCDGAEDCYVDADEDSYRPDATSTVASGDADCSDVGEALASALTGDCDDADAAFHPFASEGDCSDANDYNCDGSTGYIDADGDGSAACEECDDADAAIFPGATEVPGDGVDGDCSGADTCYVDADDDGYRPDATATVAGTTVACDGAGEAASSEPTDDCDDADPTSNPGAIETVGDGVDNDCDGDETCFVDADDDGYRSEDGATVASTDGDCADVGEALALAAYDCDDGDDTISPTATELVGDGVDGDCDGTEDCYADADGDGVRPDATSLVPSADATCDGPGEATTTDPTGDCDDTDATAYPGAPEVVGDGVDEDCDGAEDCYTDLDDDGYTDGDTRVSADTDCADASEATADDPDGDCDDTDDRFHPDATESDCTDPSDYNCDGSTGYDDVDGDRYAACEDCDDTDATVRPGAVEAVGDGVDQDCDQLEDCYVDADDDGYRPDATSTVSTATVTCTGSGEAFVTDPIDDCDDADATVNPGATEVVADGIDEDCDGDELCWLDADNDGYTADEPSTIVSPDLACDSTGEADGDAPAGDCDDTDDDTNPGAAETDCLDPADYNCDGSSGSIDGDADGFAACEECDDGVAAINPDADEVCNDLDDDCDGTTDVDAVDATTWYVDSDGDGYTDPDASVVECDAPEGYMAATEADCDDDDAAVNPGGDDVPGDTIDQDCDGVDAVAEGEGDDTGGAPKEDGCGCATADPVGLSALMLAALVLVRRRRGQPGLRGVGVTRASVPGTCGSRGRR
jgi:MYXO-CTERM domain-containing protein